MRFYSWLCGSVAPYPISGFERTNILEDWCFSNKLGCILDMDCGTVTMNIIPTIALIIIALFVIGLEELSPKFHAPVWQHIYLWGLFVLILMGIWM